MPSTSIWTTSREGWTQLHRTAAGYAQRHHQHQHQHRHPHRAPAPAQTTRPVEHISHSAGSSQTSSNPTGASDKPARWYASSSKTAARTYGKARTLWVQAEDRRGGVQAGERGVANIPKHVHEPCDEPTPSLVDSTSASTIPPPAPRMKTVPLGRGVARIPTPKHEPCDGPTLSLVDSTAASTIPPPAPRLKTVPLGRGAARIPTPTDGPSDESEPTMSLLDSTAASTIPPPTPRMKTVPLDKDVAGIPTHGLCDDSESTLPLLHSTAARTIPPPAPRMRTIPLPVISEEEDRQWRVHLMRWEKEERTLLVSGEKTSRSESLLNLRPAVLQFSSVVELAIF